MKQKILYVIFLLGLGYMIYGMWIQVQQNIRDEYTVMQLENGEQCTCWACIPDKAIQLNYTE